MAGRPSHTSRAAATARAQEASWKAPKFQEHSRLILASPIFQSSRRSQDFLTYIVEKSLTGQFDELKERSIGVAVFGRAMTYDTGADAIVRVTASDVRRRLHQFYAESPVDSGLRIELPAGSYLPEFLENQESPVPSSRQEKPRQRIYAALGLFALITTLYGIWHVFTPRSTEPGVTASAPSVKVFPWSLLFDTNRDLRIIFADPDISYTQHVLKYQIALSDYANQHYFPDNPAAPPEAVKLVQGLRGVNVASVDSAIAVNIVQLAKGAPLRLKTHTARSLHILDFKTEDNFILLGSPRSNPWFGLFQDQLGFRFERDPETGLEFVRNYKRQAKEEERYLPTAMGWATGNAYAIVALVANSNQKGHALLLAGSNAEATEAAGKFVTNSELLGQTLRNHGITGHVGSTEFEILLRVGTLAGSPNRFEVVACHKLN